MPDIKHFDPSAVVATVTTLLWERGWTSTGIREIVDATGVGRSSLYATFGSKQDLCLAALRTYLAESAPAFTALRTGGRGLPDIAEFFDRLLTARCTGRRAGWGCLATNLATTPEGRDPAVDAALAAHQRQLRDALRTALSVAARLGQVREETDVTGAVEQLVLLAHGVNLLSRAGTDAHTLHRGVDAALSAMRRSG